MEATMINKEELPHVRFSHEEVITDHNEQKLRMAELYRAQILGNLEKLKVSIEFQLEDHSHRKVETTVWAVGQEHIMLKSGIGIPIRAVESIKVI